VNLKVVDPDESEIVDVHMEDSKPLTLLISDPNSSDIIRTRLTNVMESVSHKSLKPAKPWDNDFSARECIDLADRHTLWGHFDEMAGRQVMDWNLKVRSSAENIAYRFHSRVH